MPDRRTTTKQDILRRVCHKTGFPLEDAKFIVQQFLDEITDELARGGRLEFRDFGVFKAIKRKGRAARNPKTGRAHQVPDQAVPKFTPGRLMKERLARLDPAVFDDGKYPKKVAAEEDGGADG